MNIQICIEHILHSSKQSAQYDQNTADVVTEITNVSFMGKKKRFCFVGVKFFIA
jgi:hypothetical protein